MTNLEASKVLVHLYLDYCEEYACNDKYATAVAMAIMALSKGEGEEKIDNG